MPEVKIVAETGRPTGSRPSGRLRAEGKVPAVIYGHGIDPISVAVDGRTLRAALSTDAGLNALLSVEVDGTSHLAMARVLQRHPVRNTVVHVDFQVVRRDEVMSVEVPVVLVGDAELVTRDRGVVEQQLHTLTVQATPDRIPHSIEVDVAELRVGDTVRVGDLKLPAGASTDLDPEAAVVIAQPPQVPTEGELVGEAEAEAAAVGSGAEGEGGTEGSTGAGDGAGSDAAPDGSAEG